MELSALASQAPGTAMCRRGGPASSALFPSLEEAREAEDRSTGQQTGHHTTNMAEFMFSSVKSGEHKWKTNHRTHTKLCKMGPYSCSLVIESSRTGKEPPLGEGQLVTL